MSSLSQQLDAMIPDEKPVAFGETVIVRSSDGSGYLVHHRDDSPDDSGLHRLATAAEARDMASTSESGEFRPLRTAPTLRRGWLAEPATSEELLEILDAIYPASAANWIAYESGERDPVPFRETVARQTKSRATPAELPDSVINRIMRDLCARGCLRRIGWAIDDSCPTARIRRGSREIPLVCLEACPFAIAAAEESQESPESSPPSEAPES